MKGINEIRNEEKGEKKYSNKQYARVCTEANNYCSCRLVWCQVVNSYCGLSPPTQFFRRHSGSVEMIQVISS